MKKSHKKPRSIIVHYHLFKNAGTTIDSILRRNFSCSEHLHREGPDPWSSIGPDELIEFALANPTVRAVSSHHAYLPLPAHPGIRFLPILFLRHPIDRFGSVYWFERRQPPGYRSPSAEVARSGSLADFARWAVGCDATAVCRNFQVVRLAGIQHDMRTARATADDFERALAQVDSLPFVGLVESFDESIIRMREYLRPYIGEIDINHLHENASPSRAVMLDERLQRIAEELGSTLYQALMEHNALDMVLYRRAERRIAAERTVIGNARAPRLIAGLGFMRNRAGLIAETRR